MAELKFDPGFRVSEKYLSKIDSILRIKCQYLQFDLILRVKLSIWLSISIQFDSNILQFLGIPGRNLVPAVTQILGQNDSIFYFSVRNNSENRQGTDARELIWESIKAVAD